jgi:hypothetical protein
MSRLRLDEAEQSLNRAALSGTSGSKGEQRKKESALCEKEEGNHAMTRDSQGSGMGAIRGP